MNLQQRMELNNGYTTEILKGVVERITFHNKDNGFVILKIEVAEFPDLVSVIGVATSISVGEMIEAHGRWENDKTYGKQFKAERLHVIPPSTRKGIEKYLASGAVKGVGAHYAAILVNAFGENVFEVLDHHPERLRDVSGIGKKRQAQIISAWSEQRDVRDVMVFLQSHGIGAARAAKIHKLYGCNTINKLRENPYRLIYEISGIGFKTADEMAEKLGLPKDSEFRARACLSYILHELSDEGHCAISLSELRKRTLELLGISEQTISAAIENEVNAGRIIQEPGDDEPVLFLDSLHRAETAVAKHLQRLHQEELPWEEVDVENAIPWVETQTGISLSISQRTALQSSLLAKVSIITGGPGVGKTTVVKSLITILRSKQMQVALCAPTGRAAKRLSETTRLPAKTIHRLLEFDPLTNKFKNNAEQPLTCDVVIVDEVSMLDIILMQHLLAAIPDEAALVLIGDIDQLPSVGPGAVLSDLIASNKIPTVCLKEIFRQASASQIILNAHRINEGQMPLLAEKNVETDFYFINVESADAICKTITELVTQRIPQRFGFHAVRDIQVLAPMNKGGVGTHVINNILQQHLNGDSEPKIRRFDAVFSPFDKVIQTVNNYEKDIFNGDVGQIIAIDSDKGIVKVNFEGRTVEYKTSELEELSLAYAMSIHKSQGSEYPAVVIALASQHHRMLVRNLLYTAVTRGKKLVVIVGQKQALHVAVNTVQTGKRITRLAHRLDEL